VIDTFETRVAAVHSRQPLHLILVDTAPNDVNVYHYARHYYLSPTVKERLRKQTELMTEAFVLKVAALPQPPAVAFVETAWFERVAAIKSAKDADLVFGAWSAHKTVLDYYGIPMINMPRSLAQHGLPATRGSTLPLSRAQLFVDGLHLSSSGHRLHAFFVASALVRPPRGGQLTAGRQSKSTPPPRASMDDLLPLLSKAVTSYDFTNPLVAVKAMKELPLSSGWKWSLAEKVNRSYVLSDAMDALRTTSVEALGRKKLGLSAAWVAENASPPTFTLSLKVRLGLLRVGYLRSYQSRANLVVDLGSSRSARTERRVLNGTWDREVSIYYVTTLDLRPMLCPLEPSASGLEAARLEHHANDSASSCSRLAEESTVQARFTLSSNADKGGDFTVSSILSY